jgi:hypothetical protein
VGQVEKHIVLLQLNHPAIVLELYFARSTKHKKTMILKTHAPRGQLAQILHQYQIVAWGANFGINNRFLLFDLYQNMSHKSKTTSKIRNRQSKNKK